ncbi:hypothetical protein B0H67DRAFT_644323 [Lasiosphaeris hirsuta]|uniref:Cytochrome P450 n=1 Tax=Lasiosphaeris hirsuta TaxID=260670 RepID=A0AA40E3G2_9PEZI|nr:hypothetical protein B0H67DRAFT_644323 [Lasiosphaeris hirsuta]
MPWTRRASEHFPQGLQLVNMLIIVGAGYTTASAPMSWLIYCIVTYPETQDKILQELVDYGVGPDTEWTPKFAHSLSDNIKNCYRASYMRFATGPRCIGFNFALLKVKNSLSELVYRYKFVREGLEAIEYDPEFQLVQPLNLFVMAKRRTEWLAKSA